MVPSHPATKGPAGWRDHLGQLLLKVHIHGHRINLSHPLLTITQNSGSHMLSQLLNSTQTPQTTLEIYLNL